MGLHEFTYPQSVSHFYSLVDTLSHSHYSKYPLIPNVIEDLTLKDKISVM